VTGSPAALLGLLALLFLGAWGWGWLTVRALRRSGWDEAEEVVGPALQLVLGVAVVMALGGFMVAADVAYFWPLVVLQLVGVAALAARLPGVLWRRGAVGAAGWIRGAGLVVAGGFVGLLALGQAMGYQLYNPYDDDAAYVYLAKRLLATGGLIDPFNLRRITSYGANTLYQSLFLGATGNASLRGFELMFSLGVLLVVAVGTLRRRFVVLGTLVLGTGLAVGGGIGPIINLSPLFSVAALSLGVYVVLRRVAVQGTRDGPQLYVVLGILLAGILALRFYFLISVGCAVVFVLVAVQGRGSVRSLARIAATGVVCMAGWAVALARSSGTPVFPLISGNYNTSWPSGNDPTVHGIHALAARYYEALARYGTGWVAASAVALAALVLVAGRRHQRRMIVVLGAGLGCLVQTAVISVSFSADTPVDVARFVAPSCLAAGLAALDAVWPLRRSRRGAGADGGEAVAPAGGAPPSGTPGRVPVPGGLRGRLVAVLDGAPARGLIAVGLVWAVFNVSPLDWSYRTGVTRYTHDGVDVLDGTIALGDRYAGSERQYAELNAMIPRGAKVLAAVDLPTLLDMTRYDVVTLDSPGAVSPPPHMPFFRGAAADVAYLRAQGFDYIVAESPSALGPHNLGFIIRSLRSSEYFSREQAAYNIDWQGVVTNLEQSGRYPVRRAGQLALVDIR